MHSIRVNLARGIVLTAGLVMLAAPVLAQAGPPPGGPGGPPPQDQPHKKKHHNSGVGAGIAAGVLGGIAGAAILGNQGGPPPPPPPPDYGYQPPPPPPPGPRYGDYAEDDEPECHLVRKPVYDEDGQVVEYRTRRVCR